MKRYEELIRINDSLDTVDTTENDQEISDNEQENSDLV